MFGGDVINGLWIAFIGWFLESAAVAQVQYQMVESLLAGHSVSDAMSRDYTEVPASAVLQELVEHHILAGGRRSFVVKDGDTVAGLLTLHHVKAVPHADWPRTTAAEVMIPTARMKWIGPDTGLAAAMKEMDSDGVNQLPVLADGRIVGMLTREAIISFLRTLQEIQP